MDSSEVELAPQDLPAKLEIKTECDVKPNYDNIEIQELKYDELINQDTDVPTLLVKIKSDVDCDETPYSVKVETVLIKQEDADVIQMNDLEHDSNKEVLPSSNIFKCTLCNYASPARYLRSHLLTHATEKFKCSKCDFRTKYKSSLKEHAVTHSEEKPFVCDKCHFRTRRKRNFARHQAKHSGERAFKCTQCNFSTWCSSYLRTHSKIHTVIQLTCNKCDYATYIKHDLHLHMITHNKDKPYVCDQCDFASKTKKNLIIHKRFHTNELIQCDICNFSTNRKNSLRRHIKSHKGWNKTYICNVCNANFTTNTGLKQHMDAHNPVKCYRCDKCSFSSQDINQLVTHMKTFKVNNINFTVNFCKIYKLRNKQ